MIVTLVDQAGNTVVDTDIRLLSGAREIRHNPKVDGTGDFTGLPAGKYQLQVTVSGFGPYHREIELPNGETKHIEVVLEPATIVTNVDVTQNDSTDVDSYGKATELSKSAIDNLPDDPEQLKMVLQRLAGETLTGEDMPISVNGMPGAPVPTKGNIKAVRINRNIFSAQYEGMYGGGIEIITDSQMKKISGWGGFSMSDARLRASDPIIGRRVPGQNRNYNYGVEGPLSRTTTLSANGWSSENIRSTIVNATILDPNLEVVGFQQTLKAPARYSSLNITIGSDPNKHHKIYTGYSWNGRREINSGVGGFSLPSRANSNRSDNHNFGFSDTFTPNPNLLNVFRLSLSLSINRTNAGNNSPALNVQDAFYGGGSPTDQSSSDGRVSIYNDTTWKHDRWSFGVGVMIRGQRLGETSRTNFGGTYTFAGKIAPILDSNNQPVHDAGGNIVTTQISSIESYRRNLLFRSLGFTSAQIRALGGGADQFTIAGGKPGLNVSQFDIAVYEQNSYSLTDTVGISFGLRYERQTNIHSNFNLAPRVGFIWSPKVKEKQRAITAKPRISAGVGLFYSRFGLNNTLSSLEADNVDRAFYFVTDPTILDQFPIVPSIDILGQSATPRTLRLIDSGFRSPRQYAFNVSITKSLIGKFGVNFTYTRTLGYMQTVTRNINAPFAASQASAPVYPFGAAGTIYNTFSPGKNDSDRFGVNFNFPQWKPWGKYLYIYAGYNFIKSRGNTVSGSGSPTDPYDFSHEWGPNSSDGTHEIFTFFALGLPHRYSISANIQYRTGSRFNIITGRDTNRDGFYNERPAFATAPRKPGVIATKYGLLDPNPSATDNLIPRNLGRSPSLRDFSPSFSKSFGYHRDKANKNQPRQTLTFRITVSNIFNFNNKGTPVANMSSPNFLKTNSGFSYDGSFSTSNPRNINLGASFSF